MVNVHRAIQNNVRLIICSIDKYELVFDMDIEEVKGRCYNVLSYNINELIKILITRWS